VRALIAVLACVAFWSSGSRRGARDADQAERRFLRILAAKLNYLKGVCYPHL
jgi:hypothetical protein